MKEGSWQTGPQILRLSLGTALTAAITEEIEIRKMGLALTQATLLHGIFHKTSTFRCLSMNKPLLGSTLIWHAKGFGYSRRSSKWVVAQTRRAVMGGLAGLQLAIEH